MLEDPLDLAAHLEGLLPRLMRILYRSVDEDAMSELPVAQIRILRLLYSGNRTVTSLGEELGLTASAVTQMANRLQEAALVERAEDSEDRRVKHLALTEHGWQLMRARQAKRIARARAVLERLPIERQQEVLRAINDLIKAAGDLPKTESLAYIAEIEQAMPPVPPFQK